MQIAKKVIDGKTLTFHWADETSTVFNADDFSPEILERAMMAGLGHKLGDAYSGSKGDVRTAQAMQLDVSKALLDGDWNRKGGGFSSGGIMIEAIAAATGEEIETVLAKWNEMDEATRKGIAKHPDVKVEKAKIELARATAKAGNSEALTI